MPMIRRINAFAPAVCAALLIGAIAYGGFDARTPPGADDYFLRVRTAIERLPYRVGPAVGRDQEPTPAAQRMLKPNKLLQRRYENPETGRVVNLLIVHCGDVRDMLGHYPPNCYPSHGWDMLGSREVTVEIGGGIFPARTYDFSREINGQVARLSVTNFFALPTGETRIVADMDAIDRVSRSATLAGLGAAQIQVITGEPFSEPETQRLVGSFIDAVEPVVREITGGVR